MLLPRCSLGPTRIVTLAAILSLSLIGCGKKAPEAIDPNAAAQKVEGSFEQASPEVKTMVDNALEAMANNNLPRAHVLLQTLVGRTDLTPDQRDVITSSLLGVGEKLRESAASGDEKAQEFQRMHQSSK